MKKIIIVSLFCMMLLINMITFLPVVNAGVGVGNWNIVDFEDTPNGSKDISVGDWYTGHIGLEGTVVNAVDSYVNFHNDNCLFWSNLSYSSSVQLCNFSTELQDTTPAGNNKITVHRYYDDTGYEVFRWGDIDSGEANNNLGVEGYLVWDWDINKYNFQIANPAGGKIFINTSFNFENLSVRMTLKKKGLGINVNYLTKGDGFLRINSTTRITQIVNTRYVKFGGGDNQVYLQQFKFKNIGETSEDDYYTFSCPAGYKSQIGSVGYYTGRSVPSAGYRYLWYRYNVQETMNIGRIALEIHSTQGSKITSNDVECKLNEYDLGTADALNQIGENSYVLYWDTAGIVNIEKDYVKIMFKSYATINTDNNQYWDVHRYNGDLNNDGSEWFSFLNNNFDGVYNNFNNEYNVFSPTASSGCQIIEDDLVLKMCMVRTTTDLQNYTNWVKAFPKAPQPFTQVSINYQVESSAMGYAKYVYYGTSSSHLKRLITTQGGKFYYVPTLNNTKYYVNLSIDGENVSSDTFTTTNTIPDNYVYTVPNPSLAGSYIDIFYKFSPTVSAGLIEIKDVDNNPVFSSEVEPSSTGFRITNSLVQNGLYTVVLSQMVNNVTPFAVADSIHVVGEGLSCYITISRNEITLGESIEVRGQHGHIGEYVRIKIGNSYYKNVGDFSTFREIIIPEVIGTHVVALVMQVGNTEKVLAVSDDLLRVSKGGVEQQDDLLPMIDSRLGVFVGVIVVVCFTLLPLLIVGGFGFGMDISPIVYALTGSIGFIFAVSLGLFEMWTIVVFVVVAFIVMMLLYIRNQM